MSADIEKLAVFDSRIVQSRPKYAVEKGALSVTNAPFNAIAATSSQHTYNIYVPSENVFVDRAMEWSSTVLMSMSVDISGSGIVDGDSIAVPGRDFALCAFPLNSLCSTMSTTVNDTTSVINTQDVLTQVLRLTDYKVNRLQRTCPTMLDKYAKYDDAFGTLNNPLGGYDAATDYDNVPNGAFQNLVFTDNNGVALGTLPAGTEPFTGAKYTCVDGIPVYDAALAAGATTFTLYFKWRSTEKLVLPPFVFADSHEMETGLFGINNIQLIMNLVSSPARVIRSTTRAGRTISAVQYNAGVAQQFQNSKINVQFLTPSLDVPLPPKSVVPYMEFPRYLSQPTPIAPGATVQIQSQTITLPQIPDLLIVYARPSDAVPSTEGDWLFPVASSVDNSVQPLTVNFDNFSGLLSSVTAEQLYFMSVKNGLDMDWNCWSGLGHSAGGSAGAHQQGGRVALAGGPLVLKPGQDLTLQSGQAPSLVGNFTLQLNLSVRNPYAEQKNAQLVIITVNSGFFESIRGSSRIIKGVLSEQDIISAPIAPMGVRSSLDRIVGGFSFRSLANVLHKAKDVYERTKPVVSAIKGALPEEGMAGKVKGALGAVGYGGAAVGGARSGGRTKKSLAERLM